jgi:mannose-6-phosphate isomerase-like protein (cupin superfamily)
MFEVFPYTLPIRPSYKRRVKTIYMSNNFFHTFTRDFNQALASSPTLLFHSFIKKLFMKQKSGNQFILALCISLVLFACDQQTKKEDETKTTDSTSVTKPEAVQPPAPQETVSDAVKVAPDLYKVLSDSMGIRILEATYKPGDSSAMHSHPDNAVYVAEAGTAEFTDKDGKKNVIEFKKGMIMVRPGESHSVKNTGKTTLKVILVEVNRPKETIPQDATMVATKVAPALYKLKSDSLGIRVLEITYKPGQSSALHSHPDNALYVINGGTTEFTEKDGTKHTNEFKTGMTGIRPGGVHSVKNTGKTTLKALLVEVNRPGK